MREFDTYKTNSHMKKLKLPFLKKLAQMARPDHYLQAIIVPKERVNRFMNIDAELNEMKIFLFFSFCDIFNLISS